MPRSADAQDIRGDSFGTSSTVSDYDIPWFSNFGKFVDNPDFFLHKYEPASSSPEITSHEQIKPSGTSSQFISNHNTELSSIPSAKSSPSRAPYGIRITNMQHATNYRRASSELIHTTGKNGFILGSTHTRKRRIEADEEAPKTLSALLRRMVSFDHYSRRNMPSERTPMHARNNLMGDAHLRTASPDPHRFSIDEQDMEPLPPTVPLDAVFDESSQILQPQAVQSSMNSEMDRPITGRARNCRVQRRSDRSNGDAPKTLGAVFRRMVSFDQYSKRSTSRAHELPMHIRNGSMYPGDVIRLSKRGNGTEKADVDVGHMRR